MPSRKKIKGKARKAKQAAATLIGRSWGSGCRHGAPTALPNSVCEDFNDTFGYALKHGSLTVTPHLRVAYAKYPEALDVAMNRIALKQYYIARGAELILDYITYNRNKNTICYMANIVLMLENYHYYEQYRDLDYIMVGVFRSEKGSLKNMDTINGCYRLLIKFFAKRIPCSCLDEVHASAKRNLPKLAWCDECGEESERRSMLWCSNCRAFQFCSRECQVEHWTEHKDMCKLFCNGQK